MDSKPSSEKLADLPLEGKESHVRRALRHVREGVVLLKRQEEIIERLRARRLPTDEAEGVLVWLSERQIEFEAHYKLLMKNGYERLRAAGYKDPTANWPRE